MSSRAAFRDIGACLRPPVHVAHTALSASSFPRATSAAPQLLRRIAGTLFVGARHRARPCKRDVAVSGHAGAADQRQRHLSLERRRERAAGG